MTTAALCSDCVTACVMTCFVCCVSLSTRARMSPVFVANEEAERQTLQMRVERVAQIARDVLLQLCAELSAHPHEQILERDGDEDDDDDVAEQRSRVGRHRGTVPMMRC